MAPPSEALKESRLFKSGNHSSPLRRPPRGISPPENILALPGCQALPYESPGSRFCFALPCMTHAREGAKSEHHKLISSLSEMSARFSRAHAQACHAGALPSVDSRPCFLVLIAFSLSPLNSSLLAFSSPSPLTQDDGDGICGVSPRSGHWKPLSSFALLSRLTLCSALGSHCATRNSSSPHAIPEW